VRWLNQRNSLTISHNTKCHKESYIFIHKLIILNLIFRWNSFNDAIKCIMGNITKIEKVFEVVQVPPFSVQRDVSFLIEYCKLLLFMLIIQNKMYFCWIMKCFFKSFLIIKTVAARVLALITISHGRSTHTHTHIHICIPVYLFTCSSLYLCWYYCFYFCIIVRVSCELYNNMQIT